MITALERVCRPVVSKLRPSKQVSWQELQEDHTVKWQSPEGMKDTIKKTLLINLKQSITPLYIYGLLMFFTNAISGIIVSAPLPAPGTFKRNQIQLQLTSAADNVTNTQTNYPVGIQMYQSHKSFKLYNSKPDWKNHYRKPIS